MHCACELPPHHTARHPVHPPFFCTVKQKSGKGSGSTKLKPAGRDAVGREANRLARKGTKDKWQKV
eukprot:358514-Chlamydomonas_euryale.AAC.5